MSRAILLLLVLVSFPASAIDLEKWVDKLGDKMMQDAEKEKLEALAKDRDPKERLEAAEWLGGRNELHIIAALGAALSDRDAKVRQAAANGLWKSEKAAEPARPQLLKALDDLDPNVVARVAGALQSMGMKEAELVAPRKRVFASAQSSMESRFLVSRNLIGHEPATRLLEPTLAYLERAVSAKGHFTRQNIEIAQEALESLVKSKDRSLIPPLMDAARSARPGQVTVMKAIAMFEPRPDGYTGFVLSFLDSSEPRVRYQALGMLGDAKKEKEVAVWLPRACAMLADSDDSVRSQALWAVSSAKGLAAGEIEKVVAALADPHPGVRRSAARAIGEIGEKRQAMAAAAKARVVAVGRPALTAAMERDPDADVRHDAKEALRYLGDAAEVVASAPSSAGAEAGGMALLRERKITFETSSFARALYEVDVETVRAFLDAGMPVKTSVSDMGPPIRAMLFSEACHPKERPTKPETKAMVKLLLERGADPNGSDNNGNTALMEAASHGCDRELTRMLIKAGAKVTATNSAGLTPFEMGLFYAHDGLEEILAAGYRLPPDKAKMYAEGYKGKAAVQDMIRKATRK
ncbi:MAG: HEAT repeat domain-containing protein [Usitatibacter sp.]